LVSGFWSFEFVSCFGFRISDFQPKIKKFLAGVWISWERIVLQPCFLSAASFPAKIPGALEAPEGSFPGAASSAPFAPCRRRKIGQEIY
jgi:hypothetical protein